MAEECIQRRLAAEMVGYSQLMVADDTLTRARLRVLHAELINPLSCTTRLRFLLFGWRSKLWCLSLHSLEPHANA
jgi:hypothetical protein